MSNHFFVGIDQVTICCEMHKLNVVLALVFDQHNYIYETNHVGSFRHQWDVGWLSSVMNKFNELLISLYPSDARVLSNHIFVGIHQV